MEEEPEMDVLGGKEGVENPMKSAMRNLMIKAAVFLIIAFGVGFALGAVIF